MEREKQMAIVTGASRGIGAVVARHLATTGAAVAAFARNFAEDGADFDDRVVRHSVDVSDGAAVDAAVGRVQAMGPVDLLVNCAAIEGSGRPTWQQDAEQWWKVFQVNVLGAFHCCRAVLPAMIERGSGRIVNVASNAAFFTVDEEISALMSSAYMASKAALVRFTEALAVEAAGTGVSVFVISPGMVKTEMTARTFPQSWFDDDSIWSPPELTAGLIEHLATGALDGMSGRYIHASADDWRTMAARVPEIVERDLHAMRLVRE